MPRPIERTRPDPAEEARAGRTADELLEEDIIHQMLLHDIRSPLHAARVAIAATRSMTSGEAEEAVGMAEAEIQKALEYLEEWSRLLSASSLEPKVTDVEACVHAAWTSVGTVPGHTLTVRPIPHWAVDPVQVRRVFQNLFTNAIRSARGRPVHVTVEAVDEGPGLTLHVHDDGPGIPTERREDLFRPVPSRRRDGHGLGLAICHRVLQAHGGTIAYIGRKPAGSTFVLTFP